jgi:hypothetical protein
MSSSRVTVYSKKLEGSDRHGLQRLLKETKADEVVALANVGREGETYLVSTRSATLSESSALTDCFDLGPRAGSNTSHDDTPTPAHLWPGRHSSYNHTWPGIGWLNLVSRRSTRTRASSPLAPI